MSRSLVPDAVERYLAVEISRETPLERRLREETSHLPLAGMQIGADQGALLAMLVRSLAAQRAIEVGTFTGYSALAVASALPAGGKLVCCDVSEEWTNIARRYWKEAGGAGANQPPLAPAQAAPPVPLRERGARTVYFPTPDDPATQSSPPSR